MSKERRTAVPRLRFPEFEGKEEWGAKMLGKLVSIRSGYSPSNYTLEQEGQFPFLKVEDLNNCDKYQLKSREYSNDDDDVIPASSVIFPKRGAAIQLNKVRINSAGVLMDSNLMAITPNDFITTQFLYYLVINIGLFRIADTSTIPQINNKHIVPFEVLIPNKEEQQKIASCLSSLDDLIAAHSQKLEALKAHKKGLKQQLFPVDGEAVPRVRFKEFEGNGEWEEESLENRVIKVGSGVTPRGGDKNYKKAGRPFIRSQNVGWGELLLEDVAYVSEEIHATFPSTEIKRSDVLLNITGASIGRASIADARIVGGNVNQHVCIIRTEIELFPVFLCQYLISDRGQKQINSFQAGGNRQGLNFQQIRSLQIPLPPKIAEQQKIASCLSSLDALIVAQAENVEALKEHKKGLMQGLFPHFENS